MKRILILTTEFPPCLGGIATLVANLAEAAAKLGHDVTVVAPDFGSEREEGQYPFELRRYSGGIFTYRALPGLLRRTYRLIRERRWDCIYAGDWPSLMALAFVQKFTDIRFIASVYGTDILSLPTSLQVRLLGVRNLFERAEKLYPISEGIRDLLLKSRPEVVPDRVAIASPGLHADWFEPNTNQVDIRARYKITDDDLVVLSVARLDERKGQDVVIDALAKLPEALRRRTIYMIVGTERYPDYAALVREKAEQSESRVIMAGAAEQSEMKSLYLAADLFCLPGAPHATRIEGFGLVYLEAGSQGVPSVAGNAGGVPEVVLDGQTGLLVSPGDIHGTAEALTKLLENIGLRSRFGAAAKVHAASFTWERCARTIFGDD